MTCNPIFIKVSGLKSFRIDQNINLDFLPLLCLSQFSIFFPQDLSYRPGDLTEPDQRHHSRSILEEKSSVRLPELNGLYVEKPQKLNDSDANANFEARICCEHDQKSPKDNSLTELIEQLPQIDRTMRQEVSDKPGESNTIPLIPAHCNFQAARKMAQENLEHQPLPDSIMDRTFLKMQAQGMLNPELALNVEPKSTGLEWFKVAFF